MAKGERDYTAHVLVLPYPAQGHINPTLQFAKRLVSRGLKATLVTTIFISKTIEIEPGPVGVEPISDGCDEAGYAEAGSVEAYLERLEAVGQRTLAELLDKQAQAGHPVSCLVYDSFLTWALGVAKGLGLTGASFFTQTCSVSAVHYHVYHGNLKVPVDVLTTVTLPALPALGISDVPGFFSDVLSYPGYMKLLLNQFSNLENADWVLFNTFDKLEEQMVKWMEERWRMITIGPTLPSMYLDKRLEGDENYSVNLYKQDIAAYMKWLDTKPTGSVVYISFGSLVELSEEHMEELACGIRGSNKYFLWVVREIEKKKLPAKLIEDMEDKGMIVTWSKQIEVLAHEAVGCFVTHCGWNSTMEALCLGVPMVCMPQWTDQPTNAKFVVDVWGVGVRLKVDDKGIVRREEMESCIKEVMEGERSEEIKRNAKKWKELSKEAMDEGGSSDKNIDEFVASFLKT
ncbi:hypothetical protein MRB53_016022 [Persea americana]|uniref:Uncharacterized protein n=1 Tax=Persea americana TaxID=3435 RepID=A0ACC2M1N5_PERAE|nr:hypothetical protein MRB53_016022 [Persea americana]